MSANGTSFYSQQEVEGLGFYEVGKNVLLSRHAAVYGVENISIGSHVRIDDFSIISGNVRIGNHCHIAGHCALYGKFGIILNDFVGLSPRTILLSATDDFSGNYLTGPTISDKFTRVSGGKIIIGKHVVIGVNSVILPGVTIGEGTAVGAMSLVKKSLPEWGIYAGNPVKFIKERSKTLLNLELQLTNLNDSE
ncbi:MAG: acyltransferase [Bacteroidota bacterium]|nr:acyltransferase [Bacteroidota bacterium]